MSESREKRSLNLQQVSDRLQEKGDQRYITFVDDLQRLDHGCREIESFCHEYDLNDKTPVNGFRFFVTITELFLEKVGRLLQSQSEGKTGISRRSLIKILGHHETAASTLCKSLDIIMMIRKKGCDFDDSSVTELDTDVFADAFSLRPHDVQSFYTESVGLFWLKDDFKDGALQGKSFLTLLSLPSIAAKIRFMASKVHAEKIMAQYSIDFPLIGMKQSTNFNQFPLNVMNLMTRRGQQQQQQAQPQSNKITIDRSVNDWRIHVSDSQSPAILRRKTEQERSQARDQPPLACLIVSPCNPKAGMADRLVIHSHGGGGVTCSCDTFLPLLSFWSQRLGVTIACPDYGVGPEKRYPHGLQDILDSYVFLTSAAGSQALGFTAKHIVLTGDSCGGHLSAGITFAINEIRKQEDGSTETPPPLMPKAMALLFPCLNPGPVAYPSNGFMGLDSPSFFAISFAFYTDNGEPLPQQGWHLHRDPSRRLMLRQGNRCRDPYFNALSYQSFEEISDVRLRIMVCEADPLLDQGIRFAKKWRGSDVKVQVARRLPHAFIHSPNHQVIQQEIDELMATIEEVLADERSSGLDQK